MIFSTTHDAKEMTAMSDLEQLLALGRRGRDDVRPDLVRTLGNMDRIVLRGAGAFGTEIGQRILGLRLPHTEVVYWDLRARELTEVHGIRVAEPYVERFDPDRTLVLNCIPNGSLAGSTITREVQDHGYHRCVSGMALYEALFCPMDPMRGFNAKICLEAKACNWCCCERLMHILRKDCKELGLNSFADELSFGVVTFITGFNCSLKCTHCGQYVNHYPRSARTNLPFTRIARDINRFFDAVDCVGFVSLAGGEPFLHPDLGRILDVLLAKKNFGMLGITTNGVCRITSELLAHLRNDRTRVIFSDYSASLPDKQRRLFAENVARTEAAGVSFAVGVPLWVTTSTLRQRGLSVKAMREMKATCSSPLTCQQVKNGVYYPCSISMSVQGLGVADYPTDYLVIDDVPSASALRESIRAVNDRLHYGACDHCGGPEGGGEQLARPGEQGWGARYAHLDRPVAR
jgi:hypothetical protein